MTHCAHMDSNDKCTGLYKGFACIKDKCKADRSSRCPYSTEEGFYCLKFNRFECIGEENCGSLDDYLRYIRNRREKAHS